MSKPQNTPKPSDRAYENKAQHPENLKEQGEAGNRTQNIAPQHRTQDK